MLTRYRDALLARFPDQLQRLILLHVYYSVTEDGIHGPWREFLERE